MQAKLTREFYVNKIDNLYYAGVKIPHGDHRAGSDRDR